MTDKILADEVLNDEQLEQVAGGSWTQTANDKNFFKKIDVKKKSVGECWKEFGISFESKAGDNIYKVGDTNYSQVGAYGLVLAKSNYPGFIGDGSDEDYTREFVKSHFELVL